jgi:hypothetical protein
MAELPKVRSTFHHSESTQVRVPCPECEPEDLCEIPLQVNSTVPGNFPIACDNGGTESR